MLLQLLSRREQGIAGPLKVANSIRSSRLKTLSLASHKELVSPHRSGVNTLQVDSAEARFLLSGASDGTIAIFDTQEASQQDGLTAKHEAIFATDRKNPQSHRFSVTSVCWYPVDTGLFVSASFDKHVKVWDANAMSVEMEFKMSGKVYSIAMSSMTQSHCLVATGSEEPLVRLCDIASGSFTHTLYGHRDSVWAVQWSVSNEWVLLSGGCDGEIRFWDIRRSGCFLQLDQHQTLQARCSSRQKHQGGISGRIPSELNGALRSAALGVGPDISGSSTATSGGGGGGVRGVASTTVAAASHDNPLSRGSSPHPQSFDNLRAGIGCKSTEAELRKRTMMAHQIKGGVNLGQEKAAWGEGKTGVGSARRRVAHDAAITGLVATSDGLRLVSSGLDSRVRLWDLTTGCNTLVNYPRTRTHSSMPTQIAVSPDSSFIYHPNGSSIQVSELLTGKPHTILHGHFDKVNCCTFHPAEHELYSGSADRQILVWAPPIKVVPDDEPEDGSLPRENKMGGEAGAADDEDAWSD